MSWSEAQQKRLSIEKSLLDKKFHCNVTWINPTSAGNTRVEWKVNTNNGKAYTLRVYIPKGYPNDCPILVVSSPSHVLKRKDGTCLDSLSGSDHIYSAHDGFTEICHHDKSRWTGINTLDQVLMKGRLWLEAYEIHLRTGEGLDTYLAHQ